MIHPASRSLRRLALGLLAGLSLFSSHLPAQDNTLEWTLWPIPGNVILDGEKPVSGLTFFAIERLMSHLPEVQPVYHLANRPRQQYRLEQGHNICSAPLFRRADTDLNGYFIPFLGSTPIQMVIRRDQLAAYPLVEGRVSLNRLLNETTLRGGVSQFRTYPGPVRDWYPLLEQRDRGYRVSGAQSGENLLLMVSHGRIDFTFELASITRAVGKQMGEDNNLLSVPIDEDRRLIESGIYCTRNAWGLDMARRIDAAIRIMATDPDAMLDLYREWMPEETLSAFEPQLKAYYVARQTREVIF